MRVGCAGRRICNSGAARRGSRRCRHPQRLCTRAPACTSTCPTPLACKVSFAPPCPPTHARTRLCASKHSVPLLPRNLSRARTCKSMQEQIYRDKGDIVSAQAVQASASTRPISLSHGSELVCAPRMAGLQGAPSAGTRWWGWTLRARSATCRGTRCGWLAASSRLPSLQSWKVQRPFCGNPLRDAPWSALPPAPLQAGPKDGSS